MITRRGRGAEGQLGHGTAVTRCLQPARVHSSSGGGVGSQRRVVAADCGAQHTACVLDDGSLVTFGLGSFTQEMAALPRRPAAAGDDAATNPPSSDTRAIIQLGCGKYHTAVIHDSGHLFTVGHVPAEQPPVTGARKGE